MINFINITKKFKNNFWEKDFFALNDVSFSINKGDLVGFLGANGAGKTTLIKILMDFSRATEGNVQFSESLGKDLEEIKSRIGYLPERAYLYQHLTGREFLNLIGQLYKLDKKLLDERIKRWSEKIGIDHALDRLIKGYSKGMQQRLGFVSVLLNNPVFLVLDEPLSGLDPVGRRDFKKIFKELNESGTTIFFSSHVVSDVEELCDKVVFIEKGKLVYEGKIETLVGAQAKNEVVISYAEVDNLKTLVVDQALVNESIKSLIERNCRIIKIQPETITLEEIIYKIKS